MCIKILLRFVKEYNRCTSENINTNTSICNKYRKNKAQSESICLTRLSMFVFVFFYFLFILKIQQHSLKDKIPLILSIKNERNI